MRRDDFYGFGQYNLARSREPKFVIEIAFDDYSLALSSHAFPVNVPHLRLLDGLINGVSATSQQVSPLDGRSQIGGMRISALNTIDETRALYDFAGADWALASTNYRDTKRTRITFKFRPDDFSANQAAAGVNSILRYYIQVTTGEIAIWRGVTSDRIDTGLFATAGEVNRGSLEWDGVGNYSGEINGQSFTGTHTLGAAAGPLFMGGNSGRPAIGNVWDVRTFEGETLRARAFYPMDEGQGLTFVDRIGSQDAAVAVSPVGGAWESDFVGQRLDTYLRGLLVPSGSPLDAGQDLRERKISVFMGFTDNFSEYVQVATTYINRLTNNEGVYTFNCVDVTKQIRKTIFDAKKTVLSASLTDGSESPLAPMSVVDTSEFQLLEHTGAFNDAPSQSVGYLKIANSGEVVRWTAKGSSPATFTIDARGLFGTTPQAVTVSGVDEDEWPEIEEFVYLEMPAPQMAYALMCGQILGSGSPLKTLPSHWHAGIDPTYMATEEWENIGEDLYNGEIVGFIVRFFHMKKIDAKKFIEQEIHRLSGTFSPVNADGTIGLRRINEVIAGAAPDIELNSRSIVSHGGLEHKHTDVVNQILVRWNWNGEGFTRSVLYQDADSINRNGASELVELKFKGLYPTRHSISKINSIVKRYMDRFRNPPQEIQLTGVPWLNIIEANDITQVDLSDEVEDYDGDASGLNRPFEVTQVQHDYMNGGVRMRCVASSGEAAQDVPIGTNSVLADAFYSSKGTALSTVLSLDGSGNLLANGTLTGYEDGSTLEHDANHADSVFYILGDFTIPPGITLTLHHSVQIRVMGTFTNNGDIDGVGNGWPGYVHSGAIGTKYNGHPASIHSGYVGGMKATDGIHQISLMIPVPPMGPLDWNSEEVFLNRDGNEILGVEVSFPTLNLNPGDQSASPIPPDIGGIPAVLTGTRGSHGEPLTEGDDPEDAGYPEIVRPGGDGGASGAGLAVISRGAVLGASSSIDLSGTAGSDGDTEEFSWGNNAGGTGTYAAGSGAGGGQGSLLILIDGGDQLFPEISPTFTSITGATTIQGVSAIIGRARGIYWLHTSGFNTGLNFDDHNSDPIYISNAVDRSAISYRVQYIPE